MGFWDLFGINWISLWAKPKYYHNPPLDLNAHLEIFHYMLLFDTNISVELVKLNLCLELQAMSIYNLNNRLPWIASFLRTDLA